MKFANLRALRINSNALLQNLKSGDVILTNRGKPVAAIIYMDEELLDSYVLAHHPTLLSEIARDVEAWKKGRLKTYTLDEVRARLGRSARRRMTQ